MCKNVYLILETSLHWAGSWCGTTWAGKAQFPQAEVGCRDFAIQSRRASEPKGRSKVKPSKPCLEPLKGRFSDPGSGGVTTPGPRNNSNSVVGWTGGRGGSSEGGGGAHLHCQLMLLILLAGLRAKGLCELVSPFNHPNLNCHHPSLIRYKQGF